jgi:hypothetical protein
MKCLFLISNNNENAVSQRQVEAKGIMMSKAAIAIDGYSYCRLIKKSASSLSLNSVSRTESDLISISYSDGIKIWLYFNEAANSVLIQSYSLFSFKFGKYLWRKLCNSEM